MCQQFGFYGRSWCTVRQKVTASGCVEVEGSDDILHNLNDCSGCSVLVWLLQLLFGHLHTCNSSSSDTEAGCANTGGSCTGEHESSGSSGVGTGCTGAETGGTSAGADCIVLLHVFCELYNY